MPIWTALLAVAFLGERLGAARIVAVVLGLVGVAVIVRPGLEHVDPGPADRARRRGRLRDLDHPRQVADERPRAWSRSSSGCWSSSRRSASCRRCVVWRTPTAAVWPWIGVIALCGTYSHYCMTQALRHADAMMIVPMDFLRVPLTAARRLAGLQRAHRSLHRGRRRVDPRRQPSQPAPDDPGTAGRHSHGDFPMSAIPVRHRDCRVGAAPRWGWLPAPGTWKYHALLLALGILVLGPLGGVTASYMNFSLGFFVGGQVLAGHPRLDRHLRLRRRGQARRQLHPDDGRLGRRHERRWAC